MDVGSTSQYYHLDSPEQCDDLQGTKKKLYILPLQVEAQPSLKHTLKLNFILYASITRPHVLRSFSCDSFSNMIFLLIVWSGADARQDETENRNGCCITWTVWQSASFHLTHLCPLSTQSLFLTVLPTS